MTRSHVYLRARKGRRDEILDALTSLDTLAAVRRQSGLLAAELQVPYDDDDQVLLWASWASREHYERWLAGPACEEMLREVGDLVAEAPEFRLYHVVDAVQ